jgi:hypothetical protein
MSPELTIDPEIKKQLAHKIHFMANNDLAKVPLDPPFDKINLYVEDSTELTPDIIAKALSFTMPINEEGDTVKFYIF